MENLDLLMKYLKANVNMPAEDEEQLREYLSALEPEDVLEQ